MRSVNTAARGSAACALLAFLFLAACGTSSTAGGTTVQSNTHSTKPTGPPTATVSLKGDAALTGAAKIASVQCAGPRVDGPAIVLQGQAVGQAVNGVNLYITIQAHMLVVRAATGSGTTYKQREFDGTGVSNFDAAKGAKVDSALTENAAAGQQPGTIGAVTSITATLDCANELAGTSSIVVTGTSPGGALSGTLTSPRVDCGSYPQGRTADVEALTQVGGRKALIIVGVTWAGITVSTDGHFYANTDPATGAATATTGHWSGDVTDASSGAKLHVSGDATCGGSTAT